MPALSSDSNVQSSTFHLSHFYPTKMYEQDSLYLATFRNSLFRVCLTFKDTFHVYWKTYPTFRAFIYLLAIMTAIPNLFFCIYLMTCIVIGISVVVIGISFVQGGLLLIGLLVLTPFLLISGFLAAILVTSMYVTRRLCGTRLFTLHSQLERVVNDGWNQIVSSSWMLPTPSQVP
ncbi:hypothetical protein HMI54_001011 [Coelomomyces lativittatus]|nr:hypothetical protein HMI56_002390 [Coelomomyces lativittatus]KAJ1505241.1 hypothetical protein HMI55_001679 [Coelomomyces lativittatus]KAJ1511151.1 hypothetical protein HMI54_001011 [Coelomomyces lativittatus]